MVIRSPGAADSARSVAGVAAPAGGASATPARLLSPAQFETVLRDTEITTINVHVPDEGQLAGTELTIPFDRIEERRADLPPRSERIALYCRTGRMSVTAAQTLERMGYRDIVDLRGGMVAWRESGRPLLPS
jgi:rhodanese-related sulfurtransferase